MRVILDGPVLEIATARGVYGAQIEASRRYVLTGDLASVQSHALSRSHD